MGRSSDKTGVFWACARAQFSRNSQSMNALLGVVMTWLLLLTGAIAGVSGSTVVIPLKGEVSEAQFFFLRRALKDAERNGAQAVVLDMDTFGGALQAAMDMQEALGKVKARTITYINPNAGSAGALIAVSTKEIYMAPISAIGAAAPVLAGGQDLSETMKDKEVSFASGYYRSVAERNGHNPDIAEAFINKNKAVILDGKTIHEKGSVLTLSAQEAVKLTGDKPLLAAGIAQSLSDLRNQAKLQGPILTVEPTGFEYLAFWITKLAPLLLLGGIVGAYIEIKTPGFGIPGILSIICFSIFFAGHYLAGLAGWEAPVIFVIGLALVISELIIHPGTILPGLMGVFLMAGSLLWAMVDRFPGQPWVPSGEELIPGVVNLGIAFVLGSVAIFFLAKYLPHTPLFRRLILATHNPGGPAFSTVHSEYARVAVGAQGTAQSILRPSGKAVFGHEMHDVITMGDFVEPGTPVRVVAVEGSRIVVERV